MGFCDLLEDKEKNINVKCFNTIGGSMLTFHVGDQIPITKEDNDFVAINYYSEDYNIFDIENTIVALVRNGVFKALKTLDELDISDIKNVFCIDIYGNHLETNSFSDYKEYINQKIIYDEEKENRLRIVSEMINSKDVIVETKSTFFDKLKNKIKDSFILQKLVK